MTSFGVFIIKFEQISHIVLVLLLLILSSYLTLGLTASCLQVLILSFSDFF